MTAPRHLVLVLGDQLNADSAAFDDFDTGRDRVWMAEVGEEATHVPSHKARIAIFLAAMRRFREQLEERGVPLEYRELDDPKNRGSLGAHLRADLERLRPERLDGGHGA